MRQLPKKVTQKSDGGMAGMTTTSGGQGVITIGQGKWPSASKKGVHKKKQHREEND